MLRLAVLGVAVLVQMGVASNAFAGTPQDVLAAGRTTIASIDADGDGVPDEPEDCNLSAQVVPNGNSGALLITGQQDVPPSDKLRPCRGVCGGSGFVSSDFAEAQLNGCDYAHPPAVPLLADFCSTLEICTSSSAISAGTGKPAGSGGGPVVLRAGAIFRVANGFRAGFGQLCLAGGPAAEITTDNGTTVLRQLFPYPNAQNPTHMCVNNVPVQTGHPSDYELKTACFPVDNGATPLALSGSPEEPFAIIDLEQLFPCGAVRGAPSVNEWGLIALAASLLAFGVWALGRRRAFAAGLPLP